MAPHSSTLAGKSHGRRSLVGCSPWGRQESDTTEPLHFHFSLSHIGEGNGNPLQCSCPENPRDGGAWWADVYGVAQSRSRLKRLSSSKASSSTFRTLTSPYVNNRVFKLLQLSKKLGLVVSLPYISHIQTYLYIYFSVLQMNTMVVWTQVMISCFSLNSSDKFLHRLSELSMQISLSLATDSFIFLILKLFLFPFLIS